jgi:hypothetical protein
MRRIDPDLAANRALLKPLSERRPQSVPDVIAVLTEIESVAAQLGPRYGDDGIAVFTALYRTITSDVLAAFEAGGLFHSKDFILELDLAFAQRYLDALRDHLDGGSEAPSCWEVLFGGRQRSDVEKWRFAVLGVNAHVNFDLAFALLDVWQEHETPLASVEAQYADYIAINEIFHRRMDYLCENNGVPWIWWGRDGGLIDRLFNRGGDLAVRVTRDWAWDNAVEWYPDRKDELYRVGPTARLDALATEAALRVL